mgnify:CR=1 FL=1
MNKKKVKLELAVNDILKDAQKDKDKINGSINWGDLQCVSVEMITDSEGNNKYRVYVEEAEPDCKELIEYIEDELFLSGWNDNIIEIITEW